jgi:hypothetical protein
MAIEVRHPDPLRSREGTGRVEEDEVVDVEVLGHGVGPDGAVLHELLVVFEQLDAGAGAEGEHLLAAVAIFEVGVAYDLHHSLCSWGTWNGTRALRSASFSRWSTDL